MTEFSYGLRTLLRQAVKASPLGEAVVLRVRLDLLNEAAAGEPASGEENSSDGGVSRVTEVTEPFGTSSKKMTLHAKGALRIEVTDCGMGFSEVGR